MAAKIDKEMLIKHHFWIGTGLCVLLVLIPLFCLIGGVSDAVSKERDAMIAAKKKGEGIKDPKNEKWVKAYQKQDSYVETQQSKVWREAYETQKDFMTWPDALVQEYPQFRTKQFGDPITAYEAVKFADTFKDQVRDVLRS
ncbi:MAG TPA: hypothetical protein VGY94_12330, partial [Acidobacteriaceae bacterium]|nr:hypothetical protein [Acidobacteriaceae bacterium]